MSKILPYVAVGIVMAFSLYFKLNFIAVIGVILALGLLFISFKSFYRSRMIRKATSMDIFKDFERDITSNNELTDENKENLIKAFNDKLGGDRTKINMAKAQLNSHSMQEDWIAFVILLVGIAVLAVSFYFINT